MRISATSTMTRKTYPRTAKTATRTRRTSTRTRKTCTRIARICARIAKDTSNFSFREVEGPCVHSVRPLFIINHQFASDTDSALENFHGRPANTGNESLPALCDFHLDVTWASHLGALKNAQGVARR